MLAALPARSLTHLDLGIRHSGAETTAEQLTEQLIRFSRLQRLCIKNGFGGIDSESPGMPGSYLRDGVARLTQLTSLSLSLCKFDQDYVAQLLAQPLPQLQQLQLDISHNLELNLTHLTLLQELWGKYGPALTDYSVLPTQLKRLQLLAWDGSRMLSTVLPLQQLQRLSLLVMFEEPQPLLQLAQLPALQHLALRHGDPRKAAAAGAASQLWEALPAPNTRVC
jgi:hypothetical protein